MNRWILAIPVGLLMLVGADARAQDSAKVQVTVKSSDKMPSFTNQRLVISLLHNFPKQDDRGNRTVDRYIDAQFSHEKGTPTVFTITLGENVKLNRAIGYFVTLSVFTRDSKLTHIGEINGDEGPFSVLNGSPGKLTISVRPAP